ncbi:F-box domain-containing protein [Favolaschia claudopus]|uniref:F-box domain-containing protein n=1 Tax=Favolaschia claudopus TaxID=2862362 RepID=A0AAW0ED07_9AGAR
MQLSTSFDLPNELWHEVFKNLPRNALGKVHAVSSLFHDISHPVLFRDFILDPDRHHLSSDEFIDRLRLYSSSSIAPHVRKLTVSFQFGRGFRPSGRWATGPISPCPVSQLLRSIQSFQNVCILDCEFRFDAEVHFAELGLQSLPNLKELRIHGGKLFCPRVPISSKISVTHFSFASIPMIFLEEWRRQPETRRSFLSALDPEALTSLTLSPSYDCSPAAWLANDTDLFSTFRNLRSVTIGCDGPFLRQVHAFLMQLPTLQHLTLTGHFRHCTEFIPTPGSSLPRTLQSFTGPREYIPLFLADTACTRLAINACCGPDELCAALLDTPSCVSAVTELEVQFSLAGVCTWTSPNELFAAFPRLKTVRIHISDAPLDDADSDVFDAAETFDPAVLPNLPDILLAALRACTTLSSIVIDWDLHYLTARLLPEFRDLHEMLLSGLAPREDLELVFEGELRMNPECESDDEEVYMDECDADSEEESERAMVEEELLSSLKARFAGSRFLSQTVVHT